MVQNANASSAGVMELTRQTLAQCEVHSSHAIYTGQGVIMGICVGVCSRGSMECTALFNHVGVIIQSHRSADDALAQYGFGLNIFVHIALG